jgi:hypothetical protein
MSDEENSNAFVDFIDGDEECEYNIDDQNEEAKIMVKDQTDPNAGLRKKFDSADYAMEHQNDEIN